MIKRISSLLHRFYFYKGIKKYNLFIYDDIFPNPKSGFRLAEFSYYLQNIKSIKFLLSGTAYQYIGDDPKNQIKDIKILKKHEPTLFCKQKILQLKNPEIYNINSKLFYCVFLSNISAMLPTLNKNKIPFIFTLYPGGGFALNNTASDEKLKNVCSSSQFRKVIVTQKTTYNYLIENNFCSTDKIEFIFGSVVPQNSINFLAEEKVYFPEKKTLDICFCAARYSTDGEDKGYPTFVKVLKKLADNYSFVKFHVIGGYDESIVDVKGYEKYIKFYGYQPFEKLAEIFRNIDIIISPQKSNLLGSGSFDGFPLGTVIEAALNAAVVISSDPNNEHIINENKYRFIPNEEIFIVNVDAEEIFLKIKELIQKPETLRTVGLKGCYKFKEIYNAENQLKQRLQLLKSYINE